MSDLVSVSPAVREAFTPVIRVIGRATRVAFSKVIIDCGDPAGGR
jgi:hypothetical protein